ncbi:MAG: PAS domain-containing protein [Chloroflexi bacterium]|nr:PAS domain-containing protein [Chloroflexota bacterium]
MAIKHSLRRKLLGSLVFAFTWMVLVELVNLYALTTLQSRQQNQEQQNPAERQAQFETLQPQLTHPQVLMLVAVPLAAVPALAFSLYVARQTTDALAVVSDAARLLASGDLDWNAVVDTGDEVESIAESLNEIARRAKKAAAAKQEAEEGQQRQAREHSARTRALTNNQQRFLTALGLVSDCVIVTDAQSRIVWINRAAQGLTGWPSGQVVGTSFGEVIRLLDDESTDQQCRDPAAQAIDSGERGSLTNHSYLRTRSGTVHKVAHLSAPVRGIDGDIIGAIVIFRKANSEGQEP